MPAREWPPPRPQREAAAGGQLPGVYGRSQTPLVVTRVCTCRPPSVAALAEMPAMPVAPSISTDVASQVPARSSRSYTPIVGTSVTRWVRPSPAVAAAIAAIAVLVSTLEEADQVPAA